MVIAPSSGNWGEWGVAPPWHSAYVMIPWWLYQYGGDRRVLDRAVRRHEAVRRPRVRPAPDGIVTNPRLGDWVSPEASPAGGNAPEDLRVSGTAYLYAMLTVDAAERRSCSAAPPTPRTSPTQAAAVKAAFNATFLDPAARALPRQRRPRLPADAQRARAGLRPHAGRRRWRSASPTASPPTSSPRARTSTPACSGRSTCCRCSPSTATRTSRTALAMQTTYPSWGYMIENGAHHDVGALGARGALARALLPRHRRRLVLQHVAGIQASQETGYRDLTIAPAVTGELDWAQGDDRDARTARSPPTGAAAAAR